VGMETMTFAIAALVLIMMPGPDQALITRNALVGGRQGGLLTMCGGALGLTVHAGAAALGLSALLVASATAFTVLKIAGALYLVWLAVQMARSAARTLRPPEAETAADVCRTGFAYLGQGILSNALNPKVALFFVTFLPQFLSPSSTSPAAQALLLSAVFGCLYLAWFGAYVAAVERLGRWLRRPRIRARIERITGVVLLGVAARLVTSHQ
jgi:threonine/homoserine/homoserine lactone efflux protein